MTWLEDFSQRFLRKTCLLLHQLFINVNESSWFGWIFWFFWSPALLGFWSVQKLFRFCFFLRGSFRLSSPQMVEFSNWTSLSIIWCLNQELCLTVAICFTFSLYLAYFDLLCYSTPKSWGFILVVLFPISYYCNGSKIWAHNNGILTSSDSVRSSDLLRAVLQSEQNWTCSQTFDVTWWLKLSLFIALHVTMQAPFYFFFPSFPLLC